MNENPFQSPTGAERIRLRDWRILKTAGYLLLGPVVVYALWLLWPLIKFIQDLG